MKVEYALSIEDRHGRWHKLGVVFEQSEVDELMMRKFGQEIDNDHVRFEYASRYAELSVLSRSLHLDVDVNALNSQIRDILQQMDALLDVHSVL